MKYLEPEMEIVTFGTTDVITGSTFSNNGEIDEDSMIKWQ